MSLGETRSPTSSKPPNHLVNQWLATLARLESLSATTGFAVLTLIVLVVQVQWGLWASQDLPNIDEAWALTAGYRLAHGNWATAIRWWKSPLYTLMYAASASVFRTIEATFYGQRLALTILSVLALYFLLRRLLPGPLPWLGAAWLAVSPTLIDLTFDRTDFLSAAICTWMALAVLDRHSAKRFAAALGLAVLSFLFRPEYLLLVAAVAFYGFAHLLYWRLARPKPARLMLIGSIAAILAIMGAGSALYFLQTSSVVGGYFMWVFANNRAQYLAVGPFWIIYERDYGPEHSVSAVLSHPKALARDLTANLGHIVQFVKGVTTSTAWASAGVRAERWLLAGCLLLLAASLRMWRDWKPMWRGFWAQTGEAWLNLACLLPLLVLSLVLAPAPVYLLVFWPAIIATLLLLGYASLKDIIVVRPNFFPALVAAVLVLAPSARAFTGELPVRHLVGFFRQLPATAKPIGMLGNASTTVCAYLDATGTACLADEWTDGTGYPKLDDLMKQRSYQYLIVDNTMSYLLSQPTGLSEVVAGRDPRWQPVAIFGQFKVFHDVAEGN